MCDSCKLLLPDTNLKKARRACTEGFLFVIKFYYPRMVTFLPESTFPIMHNLRTQLGVLIRLHALFSSLTHKYIFKIK
jgi:hypothetical protein